MTEVEFIYTGNVYGENRHCERLSESPRKGELFVVGYGPKLLASPGRSPAPISWPTSLEVLANAGIHPLSPSMRTEERQFVFRIME